jgi:hypothetical protein
VVKICEFDLKVHLKGVSREISINPGNPLQGIGKYELAAAPGADDPYLYIIVVGCAHEQKVHGG